MVNANMQKVELKSCFVAQSQVSGVHLQNEQDDFKNIPVVLILKSAHLLRKNEYSILPLMAQIKRALHCC